MSGPRAPGRRAAPAPEPGAAPSGPERPGAGPGPERPRPRFRRATPPLVLLLAPLLVYAVSFQRPAHDTWTSLASGRHVANHGPTLADPFSFASRPADSAGLSGALLPVGWVNPNWGSHLALYLVWRAGGDGGLVGFKLALYAGVAALLAAAALAAGATRPAAAAAVAAALVLARPFLEIRAQDLGNLAFAALLLLIALAERRPVRAWWLPALTAIWCNLHGSWVIAPLAAAVAAVASAAAGRGRGETSRRGWRHWAGSGLTAVAAAAALSPYRLANLVQPLQLTVAADADLWRLVGEWRSPFAAGTPASLQAALAAAATALLLAGAAAGVSWARARRRPEAAPPDLPWSLVGLLALAVALATTSRRFIAVAVLAAAPATAATLSLTAARVLPGVRLPARARLAAAAAAWAALAGALLWVGLSVHRVYGGEWARSRVHDGVLDRLTLSEKELHGACAFLGANGVEGRALNLWEDGGFLAWCQNPGGDGRLPVLLLVDGRAQAAYDAAAVETYLALLEGPAGDGRLPPGWLAPRLEELGIGIAVLPDTADGRRAAGALAAAPGWRQVYEDGRGRVLVDVARPALRAVRDAVLTGTAHFPSPAAALASEAALRLAEGGTDAPGIAFRAAAGAFAAAPTDRALFLAARAAALDPSLGAALEAVLGDHLARVARDDGADLESLAAAVYSAELLAGRRARAGDRNGERAFLVTRAGLQRRLAALHRATTW